MYWPIGTPRVYATSSGRAPNLNLFVSHDGLPSRSESDLDSPPASEAKPRSVAGHDDVDIQPPPTPITPITPITPAVQSVDHDENPMDSATWDPRRPEASEVPLRDPVLALRVARAGHLFAVITATSITVWQTKVPRRGSKVRDKIC